MEIDHSVQKSSIGVRYAKIMSDGLQNFGIGAIRVVKSWGVNKIDCTALMLDLEDT